MAGFEPAQCETPELQSGPTLQLWRIPMAEGVGFEPTPRQ